MARALLFLIVLLWCGPAQARRLALEPENRVHLGLALTDVSTLGVFGGLDSRLTRIVYVDVGGFVSPIPLGDDIAPESDEGRDFVYLRHGIYVGPGFRIPHRQPKAIQWDITGRLGPAALWSNDVHPDNSTTPNERYQTIASPSLFGGLELILRREAVGLRASGRGYVFSQFSELERKDLLYVRPQVVVEAFYQW